MTSNANIAATIRQMLTDWNAATEEQRVKALADYSSDGHPDRTEDTMSNQPATSRPYRLTRTVAIGSTPIARTIRLASYATLPAAVRAATAEYGRVPDDTLEIVADGAIVRCVYHHGSPRTWTQR